MSDVAEFWGDRGALTQQTINLYWSSAEQPHRLVLVQTLAELSPSSVLEVGCHCGVNLRLLAAACPGISLAGFDISEPPIVEGRRRLEECGVSADLRVGRAPEALAQYADGSVEWVFSCYTLSYLDHMQVQKALTEMWRVSSKGIAVFEPMIFDPTNGCYVFGRIQQGYQEFWHPYLEFMKCLPEMSGALATIHEMSFTTNALNALIVVQR